MVQVQSTDRLQSKKQAYLQEQPNLVTTIEVKMAILKMKSNKVCGPDDISADFWKSLKVDGEAWLTNLFNNNYRKNARGLVKKHTSLVLQ